MSKKKTYQQVLPMDSGATVISQFGWLPVSVYRPGRGLEWKEKISDLGDHTTKRSDTAKYLPGLRFSEFNPELAEMVIRYWSLEGDLIVDPFAGRATRGVVSLELNRKYQGYEVARTTFSVALPKIAERGGQLECFDGCVMAHTLNGTADLVFTCPPYHKLERYEPALGQLSDVPTYELFLERITVCARNIARVLKPGKFVAWVVADWRDGTAFRLFHADSLRIFQGVGLVAHDIVVVHNNSPFAPLQTAKVAAKRYTSKVHEYVLVFRKPT